MPEQRYTKRPDQVHAIPAHEVLDLAEHAWADLPQWIRDAHEREVITFDGDTVRIQNALAGNATGTDLVIYQGPDLPIITMVADEFTAAYAPADG
jgi:hypothetical protein